MERTGQELSDYLNSMRDQLDLQVEKMMSEACIFDSDDPHENIYQLEVLVDVFIRRAGALVFSVGRENSLNGREGMVLKRWVESCKKSLATELRRLNEYKPPKEG